MNLPPWKNYQAKLSGDLSMSPPPWKNYHNQITKNIMKINANASSR